MKYLLNWWRAKDIPEVIENNKKIDFVDKLDFNYLQYPKPVQVLSKMIDNGYLDEYDYLILTSPDLVVKPEDLQQLIDDCEVLKPKIMCGTCNIDMDMNKDNLAVCMEPVNELNYKWVRKGEMTGIHKVGFNGMVLMAIHKSVFTKYPWYEKQHKRDEPYDLKICNWCNDNNIEILTDFDIFMKHMRYSGKLLAGRVDKQIMWKGKEIKLPDMVNPSDPDWFPSKIEFVS